MSYWGLGRRVQGLRSRESASRWFWGLEFRVRGTRGFRVRTREFYGSSSTDRAGKVDEVEGPYTLNRCPEATPSLKPKLQALNPEL